MSTWTDAQEWLAAAMPGYETRPEQNRLALSIADALEGNEQLLAQAGCGTGKSFAALIPAILWAVQGQRTVVVSTATIALQTQYAYKDLPFLEKLFADNGMQVDWTVIKGRGNYACQAKLAEGPTLIGDLDALRRELAEPGHIGDLSSLATEIDRRHDKPLITSGSEECPGKSDCKFGDTCFAEIAKIRAKGAHVVIVNHAYLVTDATLREQTGYALLPDYDALIVDEGHELEEYTTNSRGAEFTERGLRKLGTDIAAWMERPEALAHYNGLVTTLFEQTLPSILRKDKPLPAREEKTVRVETRTIARHIESLAGTYEEIRALSVAMSEVSVHGDDRRVQARKRLKKRCANLAAKMEAVITAEADDLVRWVTREEKQGVVLKYAPLRVAPFLREWIWNSPEVVDPETGLVARPARPRAVVVMSATLSTGDNDFSYIARTLGLDDYTGFDAGTPFDFAEQAGFYVPKARTQQNPRGFADPSKDTEMWKAQVHATTRKLVLASGGRALLLYTAKQDMLDAYEELAQDFADAGMVSLIQDGETDNRVLADQFRDDETSVLFAMKSFMTGADFQGPTLQLVILNKLPFTPPDDVIGKARGDAADKVVAAKHNVPVSEAKWHNEGSFNGISIANVILILLQALGRGVRTRTDNALLVVLDPRLAPVGGKNYAKRILRALPPARRLGNLPEATGYLVELNEAALQNA